MFTEQDKSQITQAWVWEESLREAYRSLVNSGFNPIEAINEVFRPSYISKVLDNTETYTDSKAKRDLIRHYSYKNGIDVAKQLRAKFLEAVRNGEEPL